MPIDLDSRTIDRFAHTPKYRQLADALRAAIDEGRLKPGEELPGEHTVAELVGMSRDAVRKALDVLSGDGLIVRRSGAPTRVATPPPRRRMDASRYRTWLRRLVAGDVKAGSAFTEEHAVDWSTYQPDVQIAQEPATERDAELLGLKPGDPVLRREFVKYDAEGVPVQIQRSTMPWDLAGGTPVAEAGRQPWPAGTVGELFSLGVNLSVRGRATEAITARNPTDDERRRLQMETPGPVLDIVRVFYDGERAVEASRVIAPAARTTLVYETALNLD